MTDEIIVAERRKPGRPKGSVKLPRKKKLTIILEPQDFDTLKKMAKKASKRFTRMATIIVEDAVRGKGIQTAI